MSLALALGAIGCTLHILFSCSSKLAIEVICDKKEGQQCCFAVKKLATNSPFRATNKQFAQHKLDAVLCLMLPILIAQRDAGEQERVRRGNVEPSSVSGAADVRVSALSASPHGTSSRMRGHEAEHEALMNGR